MAAVTMKISPARYVEGGIECRSRGIFCTPTTADELWKAFLGFILFMEDQTFEKPQWNKHGIDIGVAYSIPMFWDNFLLFADVDNERFILLQSDSDYASTEQRIQSIINTQQDEGASIGAFPAQAVNNSRSKNLTVEFKNVEQIVGMTVK